jgi:phosphatidylserine decarboxylase
LCKQIAGALARRICNYAEVGTAYQQCDEYGFIKFGSRVDLLLPVNAQIQCKIGDVVQGGVSVLANW